MGPVGLRGLKLVNRTDAAFFLPPQARLYTRSCAVGRVLIGPNALEMGQIHWKEMCSRGNVESARWHVVQPEGVQLCP